MWTRFNGLNLLVKIFLAELLLEINLQLKMIFSNKELAEELQKPIIRKFEKRKAHSPFIDNIWGADLADMQLISKLNSFFTICN